MNVKENSSRQRKERIERIKKSLDEECIRNWLFRAYKTCEDQTKIDAVNNCIDSLCKDICNKDFNLSGFYKAIAAHKERLSGQERLILTYVAEHICCDTIELEELQSKERVYEAELVLIAEEGYAVDELYIISYPDKPEIELEKWLVTEFGVYGDGIVRPIHGCKMKKDGTPSRKAQYISIGRSLVFLVERVNSNKK
jgi:hypothetical protein